MCPVLTHLAGILAHQAAERPDAIALIDSESNAQWTYVELWQQVQSGAASLAGRGVLPNQRIGLLALNQVDWVVGFFAILLRQAVVVPLNTRLTKEELNRILSASGCARLLGDATLHPEGLVMPCEPILQPLAQVETLVSPTAHAEKLAVLVYTSGTTGAPKGVQLSHDNLLADAMANAQVIEASADDVFLTISPLFHVFGMTNMMLTAFLSGARLVLLPKFDPQKALDAVQQYGVTFLAAVPTMYHRMLPLARAAAYPSVRVCHSGAAPMPVSMIAELERVFEAPVQEGYGQSEATSIMTSNPLRGVRKPGSIGLPIPGLTLEVVDEAGQKVPPGTVGELRAHGPTVMLGYDNAPELTAQRILDGWLYTQDRVYQDEDGYLFWVGRQDDQINVGGSKLYPKTVEEILRTHPAVADCAVKGVPHEDLGQVVAAYVVLHPEKTLGLDEIHAFCKPHLARYAWPQQLHLVDQIPQGASGKVLRHLL